MFLPTIQEAAERRVLTAAANAAANVAAVRHLHAAVSHLRAARCIADQPPLSVHSVDALLSAIQPVIAASRRERATATDALRDAIRVLLGCGVDDEYVRDLAATHCSPAEAAEIRATLPTVGQADTGAVPS